MRSTEVFEVSINNRSGTKRLNSRLLYKEAAGPPTSTLRFELESGKVVL
jgi:hypothetical protein